MTDAFERLHQNQKNRPSVPPRDDNLVQRQNQQESEINNVANESEQNDKATKTNHSLIESQPNDQKTEFSHSTIELKQKDKKTTATSSAPEKLPEVVRRTIRLEKGVDADLEQLCRNQKITREVFLEAAYQLCETNPEWFAKVLEIAQERYAQRKTAGELRKLKTMENKLRS